MNLLSQNDTSTLKKILITGAKGQLGQALTEESVDFPKFIFTFLSRGVLDITSAVSIEKAINDYQPNIIINTAAYTAVDNAEENREKAYLVNETGVSLLAAACKKAAIGLIHISTDYVFDGNNIYGYSESDVPNPQTVYGSSKLAGEQAIIDSGLITFAIVRTSWVYSRYGNNFVKTMLRLANERSSISVVNDQVGTPTFANDLAITLLTICDQLNSQNTGVYNYSNQGEATWYTFAKAIFLHSNTKIEVQPVSSEMYKTKALRPKNSMLIKEKIITAFNVNIPSWETSLVKMLEGWNSLETSE